MHRDPATPVARFSLASPAPGEARRRPPAFTLLELLVTLTLIAGLFALASGVTDGVRLRVARAAARAELAVLVQALEEYRRHYGDYPRTTVPADLWGALSGHLTPDLRPVAGRRCVPMGRLSLGADAQGRTEMIDPWGGAYRYAYTAQGSPDDPEAGRGFLLYSCGPDGRSGEEERTAGAVDPAHPDNRDNLYALPP